MKKILASLFFISLLLGFQRYTLKSGTEVIYQEDHSYPLVSVVISIKAGSSYEKPEEKGLSHFLEHMLFDGTLKHSRDELEKSFAEIGTYYNAFTRKDLVSFEFVSPPSRLIPAIKLITEMLFLSAFPPEEFKKEKGVVYQEIVKDYLNPMEASGYKFYEVFLEGTPYESPVLGYPGIIKNLDRERVIKFWKALYAPSRMKVVIIGDFKFENIKDELEKIFSFNRPGRLISLPRIKPAWNKLVRKYGKVKRIDIALKAPSPCTTGSGVYEVVASILGRRIGKQMGISRYFSQYEKYRGISFIHFYGFPVKAVSATQVKKAIKDAIDTEVKEEEVRVAINDFRASRTMVQEKKIHLAREVGEWSILCDEGRRERFLREVDSSTPKKIENALRSIDKQFILIQTPVKSKVFEIKEPQIKQGKFKNGLKYALLGLKTEIKAYHLLFESRALRENFPGEAHLLFKTLEIQYRSFMEKAGINFQFTDYPFFPFDDFYLSKDYSYMRFEGKEEKSIEQAICNVLAHPLDRKAFEKAKKEVLGELGYLSTKGSWVAEEMLRAKLLSPPYNFPLYGTPKGISSASYENIEAFRRKYFSPSGIIFTGSGTLIPSCLAFLRGKKISISGSALPPLKIVAKIRGGVFAKGWKVKWNKDAYPAYLLLAHILKDRIVEVVREREGLAYSISLSFHPYSNGEGLLLLIIPTTKEALPRVSSAVDKVFSAFDPSKISKDEFERYKISLGARVLRYGERKINRAFYMGLYIHLGFGPGYMWKLPGLIESVNREEVVKCYSSLRSPQEIALSGKL